MVLVAALMIMALLSVLCVAGIATSTLESTIAGNDRRAKQAFYLCEAGLEKAKYEILKGWGKVETVSGGPPYTITLDEDTMPDVVKGWWTVADQWKNFTFVDSAGTEFVVQGSSASSPYTLTVDGGAASLAPQMGRATLYYANDGEIAGYVWDGTSASLTVPGAGWSDHQWNGYYLVDRTTQALTSVDNLGETMTLSGGTPPAPQSFLLRSARIQPNASPPPAWEVDLAYQVPNEVLSYTIFNDGNWYLVDDATPTRAVFHITSASQTGTYHRIKLLVEGAAAPQAHAFQLTTTPWLSALATSGASIQYDATGGSATFTTPEHPDPVSGTLVRADYGSVRVAATRVSASQFRLTAVSTGTTATDTRTIATDARVFPGGSVQITNWREQ